VLWRVIKRQFHGAMHLSPLFDEGKSRLYFSLPCLLSASRPFLFCILIHFSFKLSRQAAGRYRQVGRSGGRQCHPSAVCTIHTVNAAEVQATFCPTKMLSNFFFGFLFLNDIVRSLLWTFQRNSWYSYRSISVFTRCRPCQQWNHQRTVENR